MPPDRVITLRIRESGTRNDYGEYVPGQVTEHRAWATRIDKSLEDIATEGGQSNEIRRTFRIRWRRDIVDAAAGFLDRLAVVENGQEFNVENLVEVEDGRRRFLDIEAVATS